MRPTTNTTVDWESLSKQAAAVFGITAFRPGQRELVEAVLTGRDAFGILPTGGGKSLVFQLASLFLEKPSWSFRRSSPWPRTRPTSSSSGACLRCASIPP